MAQYVKSNVGYGENYIYLCSAFVMRQRSPFITTDLNICKSAFYRLGIGKVSLRCEFLHDVRFEGWEKRF